MSRLRYLGFPRRALTLNGMGVESTPTPWRFFLFFAKTFGTRELKLFEF